MLRSLRTAIIIAIAALGSLLVVGSSQANPYSSGQYGSCQYGNCSITLTTGGSVSLPVTPAGGSTVCTDQSDSVGVQTNSTTGFTLTLGDGDTNTNLVGVSYGGTVAASSGTIASPTVLTAGKWGYRVDGLSGMGSGPTSAGTNTAPLSLTFAGVLSSSSSPTTIATTSVAANPTVTTLVWYGVCVGAAQVADNYADIVSYTAVTN
jgi:hypothetical protein